MSTTLIFVAVIIVAFMGGRAISKYASQVKLMSGVEYLLLGLVIGPYGLGVMSTDALKELDLFISFVLGVMGFLVGLSLRRIRGGLEVGLVGAMATGATVLCVGGMATVGVQFLDPSLLLVDDPAIALPLLSDGRYLVSIWVAPEALWIGLAIGAAAGVSSVGLVELAAKRHGVEDPRLQKLRNIAAATQAVSVVVFGVAMAGTRAVGSAEALGLTLTEWGMITLGAGAVCGVLFTVFIGPEDDPTRIMVATVGAVTFSAGIGSALGVSPVFVNLIAGALVGISSPHAGRLDTAVDALRFPTRVLVLLLAGAYWMPVTGWAWVLPIGYCLVRAGALWLFAPMAANTFMYRSTLAYRLGSGLFGQGALSAAIAVSFAQRFLDQAALVTTTVLGGMVLTDLFSPRVLRRYLADQGAIRPHQPDESGTSIKQVLP